MLLAQTSLGWMRYPLDDPRMTAFREAVTEINGLADVSPGFIWRYAEEDGDALSTRVWDDPRILYNCSVWDSIESLWKYVFKTGHTEFYRNRRKWFIEPPKSPAVMWWVPNKCRPSVGEGLAKILKLDKQGPSANYFTFQNAFDNEGNPMPTDWRQNCKE